MSHPELPDHPWISPDTHRALGEALQRQSRVDAADDLLRAALGTVCTEGHEKGLTAEHLVMALRITWARIRRPQAMSAAQWNDVYLTAVRECLAMFRLPPP